MLWGLVAAAAKVVACNEYQSMGLTPVPWYIDDLKFETLWPHTRGADVSIAVLDSGMAPLTQVKRSKILQFDGRLRPAQRLGDGHGHGTSCVSLISSWDESVPGIAREAEVHVYETFGVQGKPLAERVEAAIEHAVSQDIDIISCSFGLFKVTPRLKQALALAAKQRALVVVASGNDDNERNGFPEDTPDVLTVGGIERDGRILRSSRHGAWTQVFAPGDELSVLDRDGRCQHRWSGTSGSAAIVAGLLALGLSLIRKGNRAGDMGKQRDRVARALLRTAQASGSSVIAPQAFFHDLGTELL